MDICPTLKNEYFGFQTLYSDKEKMGYTQQK